MTTFERIKNLAKKRGYSLTKLNDKAGLGTNSIYHWKTKTPSTDSLTKVASVLNVSVDYLLGKSDDPAPAPKKDSNLDALAAHIDDDVTEEEMRDIMKYIDFVKSQRDGKNE